MVLVHKLKQMEGLDIEQFNNDEEVSPSPAGTEDEVEEQPKDNEGEKTSVVDETTMRPASPPRRPLTRSQTGRVPKRRRRDETPPVPAVRKKVVAPRNSSQPVQSTIVTEDIDAQGDKHRTTPPNGTAPHTAAARSDTPPLSMTQLTFLDGSSSSMSTSTDRRGPRSRAVLPVPVPNLTKKSRGRRVPTKLATGNNSEQQESRLYVCNVESCGKCFHRGEHLKRHIRSIHTHEKPFKCSYPSCDKNFNRHDNLLQHLKVHKAPSTSHSLDGDKSPSQKPQRSLSPPAPPLPSHQHPYPQAAYEVNQARMAVFHQQPQFASYPTSYTSTSEPISFATNMAVSSLRTEIPHSPPTRYEIPAHQHYRASFAN